MGTLEKARKYTYLNELSTPELENILRADMASPGEGDIDLVLNIMKVIEQREGGKSPENVADTERAREEFYRIYNTAEGTGQLLYASENQDTTIVSGEVINSAPTTAVINFEHSTMTFSHKFQKTIRVGLIAAITVAVMLGVMVVAQAAGADVFGVMARWTHEVFSLGTIRYQSAVDRDTSSPQMSIDENVSTNIGYTSIQEALDAYGVTEVVAPAWIPERYSFNNLDVLCKPDGSLLLLSSGYISESDVLNIEIENFEDELHMQIEKTDAPVETFVCKGITVYLLENTNSNVAVWATAHYVYYIDGAVEKDEMRQIAISTIENTK